MPRSAESTRKASYELPAVPPQHHFHTPAYCYRISCYSIANSMAKKRLKREGRVLGRKSGRRADRVQAIAEKCNGGLHKNGGESIVSRTEDSLSRKALHAGRTILGPPSLFPTPFCVSEKRLPVTASVPSTAIYDASSK